MVTSNPSTTKKRGQCSVCGKPAPFGTKTCTLCKKSIAEKRRQEKRKRREMLFARKCKVCGCVMESLDPRKVVCNHACKGKLLSKVLSEPKVAVQCVVCGKGVLRRRLELKKRDKFCCSRDCQRKAWQKSSIKLTSVRLPVLQRCECGVYNFKSVCDNKYCIVPKIRRQIARIKQKRRAANDKGSWDYAIRLRLAFGKGRVTKRGKSKAIGFGGAERAIAHLVYRSRYARSCEWEKKAGNKLSNLRKRRAKKDGRRLCDGAAGQAKAGTKQFQMQFDWMELVA